MWMLLQSAFSDDWIRARAAKGISVKAQHVPPRPTKASAGHALGAASIMSQIEKKHQQSKDLFKMPRFKNVPCKVQMPRSKHSAVHGIE